MSSSDRLLSRRAFQVGLLTSFALAGSATSWALQEALPLDVPLIGPKWEYFERRRDRYTFVALGTSLTYRHFVPALFDRVLSESGLKSKSFNWGASRLTLSEAYIIADRIARRPPKKLRWVAIDLSLFPGLGEANKNSVRDIWWHTPKETLWRARGVLESKKPVLEKTQRLWDELGKLFRNVTPVGRGAHSFRAYWDGRAEQDDDAESKVEAEGYQALESAQERSVANRSTRFRANHDEYSRIVDARRKRDKAIPIPPIKRSMLVRIARRLDDAGIKPVFFEPPRFDSRSSFGPLKKHGPLFSYSDVTRYEELYDLKVRFDRNHLTREGATLLTTLFARDFANYAAGKRRR